MRPLLVIGLLVAFAGCDRRTEIERVSEKLDIPLIDRASIICKEAADPSEPARCELSTWSEYNGASGSFAFHAPDKLHGGYLSVSYIDDERYQHFFDECRGESYCPADIRIAMTFRPVEANQPVAKVSGETSYTSFSRVDQVWKMPLEADDQALFAAIIGTDTEWRGEGTVTPTRTDLKPLNMDLGKRNFRGAAKAYAAAQANGFKEGRYGEWKDGQGYTFRAAE